jgi:hypothetical protein
MSNGETPLVIFSKESDADLERVAQQIAQLADIAISEGKGLAFVEMLRKIDFEVTNYLLNVNGAEYRYLGKDKD